MRNKQLLICLFFVFGIVMTSFSQFQKVKNDIPFETAAMLSYEVTLLGYNVYRNNEKINDKLLTNMAYFDTVPENGMYKYHVTAVYEEGESNASNIVEVFIDENAIAREYVVFEEGTGTWCPYCPSAALGFEDLVEAGKKVLGIAYHIGDQYQNKDAVDRVGYYEMGGYPTAVFDGVEIVSGGMPGLNSMYDYYLPAVEKREKVPTAFAMTGRGIIVEDVYSALINIEKVALNSSAVLGVVGVLVENHIPENWLGLTEVNEVARDVMPSRTGQKINFDNSDQQNVELRFKLQEDWDKENCKLIAFVQDTTTKEIFQAMEIEVSDFVVESAPKLKTANLETTFAPYGLEAEFKMLSPTVNLTWKAPGDPRWMQWGNGVYFDEIGRSGSGIWDFDVAARWDTLDLQMLEGMAISKIAFFPTESSCEYTVKLWEGITDADLVIDSLLLDFTADEWNVVVLETPLKIDVKKELWVGYNNNNSLNRSSAGIDAGPAVVGKGDKIRTISEGIAGDWLNASEEGYDGNWNIKVFVEPYVDPVDPISVATQEANKFELMPNPTQDELLIKSDNVIQKMYVININGQVVEAKTPNAKELSLNVSNYIHGVYFVKVVTEFGYSFEKLVVE